MTDSTLPPARRPRQSETERLPRRKVRLAVVTPRAEGAPATRADCLDGPRPCPWVGCRFALFLDVNPKSGSIQFNWPELEPGDLDHSCALDLADAGPQSLEDIGTMLGVSRERARQIETQALTSLALDDATRALRRYR